MVTNIGNIFRKLFTNSNFLSTDHFVKFFLYKDVKKNIYTQ